MLVRRRDVWLQHGGHVRHTKTTHSEESSCWPHEDLRLQPSAGAPLPIAHGEGGWETSDQTVVEGCSLSLCSQALARVQARIYHRGHR